MKTLLKAASLLLIALLLSNCSSTNQYMVKDTNEYMEVTSKMIGDWSATGLNLDDESVLGMKYEKMTAKFDFSSRTVKFTLYVTEGKIADLLLDWKKEYPGISVDEYKITYLSSWEVSPDGKEFNFVAGEAGGADIVIKGDGENFDGFYQWEKTKYNMAKSADDGSLLGSAMGALAQSATGTSDLFPEFEESYTISISDDGTSLKLIEGLNKINLIKN